MIKVCLSGDGPDFAFLVPDTELSSGALNDIWAQTALSKALWQCASARGKMTVRCVGLNIEHCDRISVQAEPGGRVSGMVSMLQQGKTIIFARGHIENNQTIIAHGSATYEIIKS